MQLVQQLKNVLWHLPASYYYSLRYGFPAKKLKIIGITGTDGKTTVTNLLYHTLTNAGIKTGCISTIGAKVLDNDYPTGLHTTSPHPKVIQKMLKSMVDAGVTHAILEVTSHALDQHRFAGIKFDVAVLTNISHEHLDYHHTIQNYMKSKSKLFLNSKYSILNRDDQSYDYFSSLGLNKFKSYSIDKPSGYQATQIDSSSELLSFDVCGHKIITDSNYHHQIYNILAAFAVTDHLHIKSKHLIKTVRHFPIIRGRREELENKYKFRTIVDFAHTPAALEDILTSLKKNTSGRLMVIFGATGGRDKSKRPLMGRVVSEIADIAFITADDTRNENVEDINAQIISGISSNNPDFKYYDIPNRQDAFNQAVKMAQAGDTIVACGKGHETTILHGTTEYPWSESEAFRTAFRLRSTN